MRAAALAKEPSVFLPGCVHLKGPGDRACFWLDVNRQGSLASLLSSPLPSMNTLQGARDTGWLGGPRG